MSIDKNVGLLSAHDTIDLDRRGFLGLGLAGVLGSAIPLLCSNTAQAANHGSWRVTLQHAHTGDSFSGVYRVGDKYLPDAFERLNYVLRDHRTGQAFPMDPRVIDIVSAVQAKTGRAGPIRILSGYRSPKTNANLRRTTNGVARNSFHMYGQALDIRLEDYNMRRVRDIARSLNIGGVGYYSKSNFVHIDTGTVRSW